MITHKTLAAAAALAHGSRGATQEAHDLLANHIAQLTAERDRYKEALEWIARFSCDDGLVELVGEALK